MKQKNPFCRTRQTPLIIVGGVTAIWGVIMLVYVACVALAQWAKKNPTRETVVLTVVILIAVAPFAAWGVALEVSQL